MRLIDFANTNRKTFFLILWMAIVPLLFSSVITFLAITRENSILAWPYHFWLLFYLAACLMMAFALTPTTFIALLSGYFLGWQAVPLMLTAYLIASYIGFFIARFVDKGNFLKSLRQLPKVDRFMNGLRTNQLGIIILARISPVLPFAIMNVVLSMIGVKLSHFLWAGFVGMLPRTLLFIWTGSQAKILKELLENRAENNLVQISFMALLIISIAGFYFYVKKIMMKGLKG